MKKIKQQSDDSLYANRAMGAMIFAFFGGGWIVLWSILAFPGNFIVPSGIELCAVAIFVLALKRFRRYKGALVAEKNSPHRRKVKRLFLIINTIQWISISIGLIVLANIGQGAWSIPLVILVMGLHFLPLAHVFANPPHYLTGFAIIVIALTYPFLFHGGPINPIGCLGTGLVLWASAFWALRTQSGIQVSGNTVVDL